MLYFKKNIKQDLTFWPLTTTPNNGQMYFDYPLMIRILRKNLSGFLSSGLS